MFDSPRAEPPRAAKWMKRTSVCWRLSGRILVHCNKQVLDRLLGQVTIKELIVAREVWCMQCRSSLGLVPATRQLNTTCLASNNKRKYLSVLADEMKQFTSSSAKKRWRRKLRYGLDCYRKVDLSRLRSITVLGHVSQILPYVNEIVSQSPSLKESVSWIK